MNILSCAFNMDTACVELKMADGTMISIDCTAVENEICQMGAFKSYSASFERSPSKNQPTFTGNELRKIREKQEVL